MVFSRRLAFITEAAPTFGPFNRVSNLGLRTVRGAMVKEGTPETGDGSALVNFIRGTGGNISGLRSMKMDQLQSVYMLCFSVRKGRRG